jgi:hypothetical protein
VRPLTLAGSAALAVALGCGSLPPYETAEERTGGIPLTRATNERTGQLTWRPSQLVQTADGVLFEFTLVNGTSRDYLSVMLRVVLRGPGHGIATARWPAGSLAARAERRVRAHLAPPGFEVDGADLELLYAQE